MRTHRLHFRTPVAIVVAALLSLTPLTPVAHADSLQDIGKLMKQGQHSQPLSAVAAATGDY